MRRTLTTVSAIALFATPVLAKKHESAFDAPFGVDGSEGGKITAVPHDSFNQPWAMTFLPDGRMVVSEKVGNLVLVGADGRRIAEIDGVPEVQPAGQGGLGDIILGDDFEENGEVFLSYVERDGGQSGAVVDRATLKLTEDSGTLSSLERVWEQSPKVSGNGHYSHRLAIGPEGHLFITSGDRQKLIPAQALDQNLGKVIRVNQDGSIPEGNPFADRGGVAEQFLTIGHRNPLGIDFDSEGRLWTHEMGPRGGDEINLIEPGSNYGWPQVSDGRHYSGAPIPDHSTTSEFNAPEASWVPSISPAGMVIYDGDLFSDWKGDAIVGGLSSEAVIRIDLDGESASEAERYSWDVRIREIEQGPDGAIWVLEDGEDGRLVKLEPGAQS